MAIQSVTPYLMLNGKAPNAIARYEQALGAKVTNVQRFGDMDKACPPAMKDRVMHAELRVGDAMLMLSDGADNDAPSTSGNVSVALGLNDPAQARQSFEALSTGGSVLQPLFDAPWGALFGIVRDEFGVHWMFNCTK